MRDYVKCAVDDKYHRCCCDFLAKYGSLIYCENKISLVCCLDKTHECVCINLDKKIRNHV